MRSNSFNESMGKARAHQARIDMAEQTKRHSVGGFGRNVISPDHDTPVVMFEYVTADLFRQALVIGTEHNKNSIAVSVFSVKEYKHMACWLSHDRCSGYAIDERGMLNSLFSWAGLNRGNALVRSAKQNGATILECFEGHLSNLYDNHGFAIIHRAAFNPEYAPKGWNVQLYGMPCYLTMKLVQR